MKNETQVLILAGGKGTRLSSIINDVPKPMAPICDKPFLEWLITFLQNQGFYKICFLTGYKSEVIKDFVKKVSNHFEFTFSHEESPLGTGGAIKKAILQFPNQKNFLILNGDSFFNVQYSKFINDARFSNGIALKQLEDCERYGRIEIESDLKISKFREKGIENKCRGFINSGVYYLSASIVDFIPDGFVSIENEVFPLLVEKGLISGVPMEGEFIDIGIPEDYKLSQELIPDWVKKC